MQAYTDRKCSNNSMVALLMQPQGFKYIERARGSTRVGSVRGIKRSLELSAERCDLRRHDGATRINEHADLMSKVKLYITWCHFGATCKLQYCVVAYTIGDAYITFRTFTLHTVTVRAHAELCTSKFLCSRLSLSPSRIFFRV